MYILAINPIKTKILGKKTLPLKQFKINIMSVKLRRMQRQWSFMDFCKISID